MSLQSSTYPDPGFFTATSLIQFGYGIWVNLSIVMVGLAFSFPAVALPQLNSPDSDISLNISQESWIGRIITGIGVGMIMSVPRVYLTEISLPNMRGVIGSFPNVAMSIGITAQAGLGASFHWTTLCHFAGFYAFGLFFLNFLLPETPYYLLEKSTIDDAEKALKKFRSKKHNIDAEMDELMDFKIDNNIRKLTLSEQFAALFRKSSCKPFWFIMVYLLITQMSGVTILVMWAVDFLQNSKSSVDPHAGNVMLGITRLLSGIGTSILIFKAGRRPLALISGLGVGIVCLTLGIMIQYKKYPTVYPQICYIVYVIFASLGHYTLPILVMFELYPLQVRGVLGGISMSILNFMIFGANKSFPYLRDKIGFPNTVICFGCIFLHFYLPETKGLTLQEIEEYYNDLRPTLTSQRRIRSEMHIQGLGGSASRSLMRMDRMRDRSYNAKKPTIKTSQEKSEEPNNDKDK
ncbi:unnamed protein product [Leptosia nina]|uniref:Major facilitator superfamily (MFS) profile domain-containing protein n=1 Tax=Leptosia nina TaxID=320188 RepID=A0AAV1JUA4_9NEOP